MQLRDDGGVGRYLQELRRRVRSPRIREYLPDAEVVGWDLPDEENAALVSTSQSGLKQKLKRVLKPWIPPALLNLPQEQKMQRPTPSRSICFNSGSSAPVVFHEVTNYASCGELARLVLLPSLRLCVTFHDLQDLFYPELFRDDELLSRRSYYSFYKDVAQQFFAVSEFTKSSMVEKLNIPADKIKVTYLAGDNFQEPADPADDRFANRFGRYLIYPAKFWKHKNHEFLLRAVAVRKTEFKRQGLQILLTGGFTESDCETLRSEAARQGIGDEVRILGYQTNQALRALIRNATFLVFPSLFEGFGMPVLEAFGAGCPVLCAHQTSLPEVAGDAAVFFDPRQIDSLVAVFDQVLRGSIDRDELIAKGKAQFQKFSWDRTFRETAEQYAKLI
jgi:glycosyltransferase involved in cell wall biosynthesis